eukprot:scaffold11.g4014.t1
MSSGPAGPAPRAAQAAGTEQGDPASSPQPRGTPGAPPPVLSPARAKAAIRALPDVKPATTEACVLIAGATDMLVAELVERAAARMLADNQAALDYQHVASAVDAWPALEFAAGQSAAGAGENHVPLKIVPGLGSPEAQG